MNITVGYKALIEAAQQRIETWDLATVQAQLAADSCLLVDIRDVRELERDGMIEGAVHAPRGMLEFWVDPESPYHKPVFATDKPVLLYCASAWRSALAGATLKDMGVERVAQIEGGFKAWLAADLPTAERLRRD